MTADEIQGTIKSMLDGYTVMGSNKPIWALSKQLASMFNQEIKKKAKESSKQSDAQLVNEKMQELMDNPMSEEQESKALRAIYQYQLSTGELSPQLLDKMDKIIGVGTGKDEEIQLVDFKDAFPSYEEAIRICGTPQPEVCKCGGVK